MLRAERQNQIVDLVNKKGIVALEDVMQEAGISKATARRDINELAGQNVLVKIRGGAMAANPSTSPAYEPSFVAKSLTNAEEKRRIAEAAVRYIQDGDKINMDSGTTVLEVAKLLPSHLQVTVLTNDIRIASELTGKPNVDLLFVGGMVRKGYCSSYGYFAESMLSEIMVDKIFFSVDALDADFRITGYTGEDINVKKLGIGNASKSFLLCDHSKFESRALFSICSIDVIDVLITGVETDEATAARLRQLGKTVERV